MEHAVGSSGSWDIRYAHADGNGNVMALTTSTGAASARYRYSPYGELISATDVDASGWASRNVHRFSTKPIQESGLYYYGYRHYDPVTGRWPSRDPIEEEGGYNLYGFVVNDPANSWDLLGNIGRRQFVECACAKAKVCRENCDKDPEGPPCPTIYGEAHRGRRNVNSPLSPCSARVPAELGPDPVQVCPMGCDPPANVTIECEDIS